LDEAVSALRDAADPQIATIYQRRNPEGHVWGVRYGDMGSIVKQIELDAELAVQLWDQVAHEPRTLALRLMPVDALTVEIADKWVNELEFSIQSDELAALVYKRPFARERMDRWIEDERDLVQRTGWALLYGFAADSAETFTDAEWKGWLNRIEQTIQAAPNWTRESMNNLPVAIGLRNPALFEAAIACAINYGKISVFHGDKTNCKVNDPVALLNNPRTRVVRY
jgi:3-methyladenine DNA glycosylase AlkD